MTNSMEELMRVVEKYRSDFPRLRKELKRFLKKGMETDDILLIGAASYYFALISFNEGQRTAFFSNVYKAATMLEKTSDYTMIARSLNLLGIAYVAQENYQLALESYNKALQVIREHRSCRFRRDTVLSNMAECFFQMGEYERSIRTTLDCLRIARSKTPDAHDSITIYGLNLSEYYEAVGDYLRAEEILDSVSEHAEKIEPGTILSAYYARRTVVAYVSGDPEKGAEYADILLEAVGSGGDTYEIHPDFEKIVHAALQTGDFVRSKRFADILQDYTNSSDHTVDRILATRVMAEYLVAAGEKDRALGLYIELNELYRKRMKEEKAMQFSMQKKIEESNRDIKKLLQKVRISEEIAEKDPLTKLLNRTALISVANEFIRSAKSKGRMLGGIFIDIDFFKEYNDTYGHAQGDEVIKLVASACHKEESSSVRFARYGGDEFLGLVLGEKNEEIAALAARICSLIRSSGVEHIKNPNGQRVTVSVGVVNLDMSDSENTIIDVINRADKALYHAKAAGKNAIFSFDHSEESGTVYNRIEY